VTARSRAAAVPLTQEEGRRGEGARRQPAPGKIRAAGPKTRAQGAPPFAGQRGIALLHDPAPAASPAGGIPGA